MFIFPESTIKRKELRVLMTPYHKIHLIISLLIYLEQILNLCLFVVVFMVLIAVVIVYYKTII